MDHINDDNDMADKILKRLQSIINEDDLLLEFSLIPSYQTENDRNVSPIRYSLEEHCVGLETWCIKQVYKHAQHQIFKLRKKSRNISEASAELLNMYLNGALLIQPEVTTFWNIKRELLSSNCLDIHKEKKFSRLVLSCKTKSFEAFIYRTWLIRLSMEFKCENMKNVFDEECEVLELATRNTPNNYHAWNHRIWCMQNIVLPFLPKNIQMDELQFSENWILTHVSEHTGFHYRQHVLNRFKHQNLLLNNVLNNFIVFQSDDNSNIINSMLDSEFIDKFEENDIHLYNQYICLLLFELYKVLPTLHHNYPGHESIWYHRRYVIYHIHQTVCEIYGLRSNETQNLIVPNLSHDINIIDSTVSKVPICEKNYRLLALESSYLYKTLISKEKEFLKNVADRNKWNTNDVDLLQKYEKWLHCILGFNL